MIRPNLSTAKGFTLLELLLAVMIFALIILGAQQIFSMAVKNADALQAWRWWSIRVW